jgi:carbon storage regulator
MCSKKPKMHHPVCGENAQGTLSTHGRRPAAIREGGSTARPETPCAFFSGRETRRIDHRHQICNKNGGREHEHRQEKESAMLVLSRKVGEKIVIGDGITLTITRCQNGQVRLGIEAPPNVPILRAELADIPPPPPGPPPSVPTTMKRYLARWRERGQAVVPVNV